MGPFFRVFGFMGQVIGMIGQSPTLLTPLVLNLVIAVPVNIVLAIASAFIPYEYAALHYVIAMTGLTALYFIDYFAGGLTTSMVYDQVTTGKAGIGSAIGRTLRASPGILIFAVVSAILDFLTQLAQQRKGVMEIVGPILLGILRGIWTTATYVIMPAMVVERLGFFDAFRRSKQLMENDPTQVGVGFVGIGIITYLLSTVTVGLAFASFQLFANMGYFALGIIAFFTMTNLFWALSSYIKGIYYTCFYLWALECERHHQANPQLAPAPLRNVIAGAM